MAPWSSSRGCNREIEGGLIKSAGMHLLYLFVFVLSCHACPDKCLCTPPTVKCQNQNLDTIPHPIPANTKFLFITGNRISRISEASFPTRMDLLTELYLSDNNIEYVDEMVFERLPNLMQLDLSNNTIQNFSDRAFPLDNKLQILKLSASFHNHSMADVGLAFLRSSPFLQLTTLDLSNNDLVVLTDGLFDRFSNLATLNLQNSSLVTIFNGTLRQPPLCHLDLRDNSLRGLPITMLEEFSHKPCLKIKLVGNPWRCDCVIDNLLMWLRNSSQVEDMHNLTCSDPQALRRHPLLQVQQSQLKCTGDMEGVLETSYVFLGLVLALIGVIFLLVLYLNRKGIKRWMYNIRDACRDHMEGYHYRYEINSDPRLANLSINSDV